MGQLPRDVELLVAEVVEFENDRVHLSTVDAGVRRQVVDEELGSFGIAPAVPFSGEADVLRSIGEVVLAPILGLARAAVVVPLTLLTASPREVRKRFLLT